MTIHEVEQLKAGDLVYYTDPDLNICSQFFTVQRIFANGGGELFTILDEDGDEGQAYASELELAATCDNCGEQWRIEDLKTLAEVHHLWERLDPGSTVPHGECPDCGAFCYA